MSTKKSRRLKKKGKQSNVNNRLPKAIIITKLIFEINL